MGQRYKTNAYDTLKFNCNHFTEEFLREITSSEYGLPSYLNRAARFASWFHCFVPKRYLIVTPDSIHDGDVLNNINTRIG